jgi:hypothetical protein
MLSASTLVRGWVHLYTRGLAEELRDGRRAEIESDLWAHAEDSAFAGHGSTSIEIEMVARLVLGMSADIDWRWSHRGERASTDRKEITVQEPRSHQVLTVIGIAVAFLGLAFGVIEGYREMALDVPNPTAPWLIAAFLPGPVLALVGLAIVHRHPVGGWMAAIGGAWIVILFLAVLPWMLLIGLALGLPLLVIGAVRAQQVTESRRQVA